MDITITTELIKAVGAKKLEPFGVDTDKDRWGAETSVDLACYPTRRIRELHALLTPHTAVKGTRAALRDVKIWLDAAEKGAANVQCSTLKQFASLAFEFLQATPRHHLYLKDAKRGRWRVFYAGKMHYSPPRRDRHDYTPGYVTITGYYKELGIMDSDAWVFHADNINKSTVPQILAAAGLLPESPELRAEYEAHVERLNQIGHTIGAQFLATGIGTDNLDGNPSGSGDWQRPDVYELVRHGAPSRVVIDVFREEDNNNSEREDKPAASYWRAKSYLTADEDAHDADDIHPEDVDEGEGAIEEIEIPIHPLVPVFDFRHHLRMRTHVADLTEYPYDVRLGDKLVLPDDERRLVEMLLHHKGGFTDIIKGKGGGAIILCAGVPGTGKTLTAEVYAEVMQRPIYSVQCSQLGLSPSELETELLKVFTRAQRWGAILLLDEADVYVASRGYDLQQNAIVGVFLRVLEYYSGVLFLTTNRANLVDDAIASRCIARIDYAPPSAANQQKIWQILAGVMDVHIPRATIINIAAKFPHLTGRDVKNLLKLAALVSSADGRPIDLATVEFVMRFKPTSAPEEGAR